MWSSCGRCWWSVSSCHRLQPCVIELLRGYLCPPPKWPLPPPECPPLRLELLPLDTLRDDDPPPEKLRDEPPPEILLDELRLELPEKLRDIIVARYYYGYRFSKIGEMMDISEANARVSHARALAKLKEIIENL